MVHIPELHLVHEITNIRFKDVRGNYVISWTSSESKTPRLCNALTLNDVLSLLNRPAPSSVGWWEKKTRSLTHTQTKTQIYFGNRVNCLQQCHYNSLFAGYVSSFITVCWRCDFCLPLFRHCRFGLCTRGGEERCLWCQYGSVLGVFVIICFSALAFGNWNTEGDRSGKRDKVQCVRLSRGGERSEERGRAADIPFQAEVH